MWSLASKDYLASCEEIVPTLGTMTLIEGQKKWLAWKEKSPSLRHASPWCSLVVSSEPGKETIRGSFDFHKLPSSVLFSNKGSELPSTSNCISNYFQIPNTNKHNILYCNGKRLEPFGFSSFLLCYSFINLSYQNCHETETSYIRITSDVSCSTSSCLKRRGQDDLL